MFITDIGIDSSIHELKKFKQLCIYDAKIDFFI